MYTLKFGLLSNNPHRSWAKNLHELLGERHSLNVIYQPKLFVGLTAPVSMIGSWRSLKRKALVNGNLE